MSERQLKWDRRFLELAKLVASWSLDPSTQTGAVIVDPLRRIVSTGFNGMPQKMPDYPEWYADREEKYSRILHCEVNSILFAHRDLTGCTLYTHPFISCDRCIVVVAQAGITRCVAPKVVEPSHLERWEPIFKKSRQYAAEMGITIDELEVER
jgi:dCMP deaminase